MDNPRPYGNWKSITSATVVFRSTAAVHNRYQSPPPEMKALEKLLGTWKVENIGKVPEETRSTSTVKREQVLGGRFVMGGDWKTFVTGSEIGYKWRNELSKPVKARKFRLLITKAKDAVAIWEFRLFEATHPKP